MFCPKCSNALADDALFCQKCGAKSSMEIAEQSVSSVTKKKNLVTIVFGIFVVVIAAIFFTGCTGKDENATAVLSNEIEAITEAEAPETPQELQSAKLSAPELEAVSFPEGTVFDVSELSPLIGQPLQAAIDQFGEPDSDDYWKVTYANNFDLFLAADDDRTIITIESINPSQLIIDGMIPLDQSILGLNADLGREPVDVIFNEETVELEGKFSGYTYVHNLFDCSITVICEEEDGVPYAIGIGYFYEAPYETGYEDNSSAYQSVSEMDSALIGRWRSSLGTNLELYNNGSFNVPFLPPLGDEPDYGYWEASNGRLSVHLFNELQNTWSQQAPDTGEYNEDIIIVGYVDGSASTKYVRASDDNWGSGIIGHWVYNNLLYGNRNFTLNADGSGFRKTVNGNEELTWYNDDAYLWMTIHAVTFVDYYVFGDTLTLYYNDSSELFTRVGY